MSSSASSDPLEVDVPGDASRLVAGNNHNCVVVDDGANVLCWGAGTLGQIGNGAMNNRQAPTSVAANLTASVAAIDAIGDTTCVLLEDGSVWCWGGENGSYLGVDIEPMTPMLEPMPVLVVAELPEPIAVLELGGSHMCGLAQSERLWCWGRNNQWQLGLDNPPEGANVVEVDVGCPPGAG
jgi:alpha-tubulin suppressor-like RCC1 family protein